MGTRNLTMVIKDGDIKIAQYGQWDGYPSGQGSTVLKFLQRRDKYPTVKKRFDAKLKRCKFTDDAKEKEIVDWVESIGGKDGWLNSEQADLYHKKYPLFTRDNGAEILNMVCDTKGRDIIWLRDETEFMVDGLFNEWSYVIDLDKNVLEVYKGFSKVLPPEDGRFYNLIKETEKAQLEAEVAWEKKAKLMRDAGASDEVITKKIGRKPYVRTDPYYTQLVHSFDLAKLPTYDEFIKALTPEEEEE